MKIAITGALGHIGSKLIRSLFLQASELILIDNLSSERYGSLFNLPANTHYTFFEADILNCDLDSLFKGVDVVIHLAAYTNAAGSFEMREKVESQNFNGTKRVAESCLRNGTRLLYFSTTSVYGPEKKTTVAEDCDGSDLKPQSPYAETKLKEEEFLRSLSGKLQFTIFRLGTIFGTSPGMRFHTAVNKFCWQAVMGQPITVWKSALHQTRSYLDLNDASRAVQHLLKEKIFAGDVYNILTLNTTVETILKTIQSHIPHLNVKFVDSKIMNDLSYEVRCDKFKRLGFQFTGNLAQGVSDTVSLLQQANSPASILPLSQAA